jgi:CHAT domain-containing protein
VGAVNQQSGHLSNAQIEEYGNRASGAGAEKEELLENHLAGCSDCRSRLLEFQRTQLALLPDRTVKTATTKTATTSDCPDEEDLRRLAAGLCSDSVALTLATHAATCDRCGPLLQAYTEDFSDDFTPEEQAATAGLESASPQWQQKTAREMIRAAAANTTSSTQSGAVAASSALSGRLGASAASKPAKPPGRIFPWKWALIPAATAAAALVAFAIWYTQRDTPEKVEKLLAQAYTEQRTIEMKFPGSKYSDIRVERAAEDGDLPGAFFVAEGIIKQNLVKQAEDPAWLDAQAKADLLRWRYNEALKALNAALAVHPDDPNLLLDKATALFEKGSKNDDQRDYGAAIDVLGQLLARNPDNSSALFNRAILAGKVGAYRQAADDWEHYLRLRPNDEWTQEARRRLQEIRKKISQHDGWLAIPLERAANFEATGNKSLESGETSFADRIEQYQDVVLQKWLETVSDKTSRPGKQAARLAALITFAGYLSRRYRDAWLADIIGQNFNSNFRDGLHALNNAISLIEGGDASGAKRDASRAINLFALSRSKPMVARATLEHVFALQQSSEYADCANESLKTLHQISGDHYTWIEVQLWAEHAICANGMGNFRTSESSTRKALELSRAHGFFTLELRILGTHAFNLLDRGLQRRAVNETHEALVKYWQTASPPVRGYQLYWNLFSDAEESGQWHLAEMYGEEAVHEIAQTEYRKSEAVVRSRVAVAAAKANDFELAREESRKSEDLISKLATGPSDPYVIDLRLARAEVEMKAGQAAETMRLLQEIGPYLGEIHHYSVLLRYYATLGYAALRSGLLAQAQSALSAAMQVAEKAGAKLDSDRDRRAWAEASAPAYRTAVELRMKQGEYTEALVIWERYRAIIYNFGEADAIAAVNAGFPQNTAAVIWAVLPGGLATWVKSSNQIHAAWTDIDEARVKQSIQDFDQLCSTPKTSLAHVSTKSKELYSLLFGPVESHFKSGETLVIEADPLLNSLAAQVLQNHAGRPVLQDHAVIYTPLMTRYLQTHQQSARASIERSNRVVVISAGAGLSQGHSPVVFNTANETHIVASRFVHATIITAHRGILAEVQRELTKADVFDFVGHTGAMQGQRGLVLWSDDKGEDEVLAERNAGAGRWPLKLAVLSACSTGSAGDSTLLEVSPAYSFLAAGAQMVVATGWSLDSQVAAEYMDLFYESAILGTDIPESARQAALQLQRQRQYAHPYYWAAFKVFG